MSFKEEAFYQFIMEKVSNKIGETKAASLDENLNLIEHGILDSLDFISMLMELEMKFGLDLDFEDVDPITFTSIQGLCLLLAGEVNATS
ncbi:acyl carrier protein [Litorilituus lipolyticus]|uniref:Acyl carrier protein n=1 Tax=Litorilituus lipolyticus TaxID=2491017 RepID=A0A502L0C6_9GAMM|nr:acyl carrier protein [Litorilituus lipolyticus]TPH17146.1 acyl carrier protein [Litorilituus lipolyticus]